MCCSVYFHYHFQLLPLGEFCGTLLMISQHCLRLWLGAWWHQAITWTNVDPDLCRHMVLLGHNELKAAWGLQSPRPSQSFVSREVMNVSFALIHTCANIMETIVPTVDITLLKMKLLCVLKIDWNDLILLSCYFVASSSVIRDVWQLILL